MLIIVKVKLIDIHHPDTESLLELRLHDIDIYKIFPYFIDVSLSLCFNELKLLNGKIN